MMPSINFSQEMDLPDSNRAKLAKRTFFMALVLPCILPAEIASTCLCIMFIYWLSVSGLGAGRDFMTLVAPLLLLLLVGLLGAYNHELYDVGKDVWYLIKAVWTIGIGYFLMSYVGSLRDVCKMAVRVAILAAALHLFYVALHYQSGMTLYEVRTEEGVRGYFIVVVGLALLLANGNMREYLGFSERAYFYLAVLVCAASVFAAMSRTQLIALLLMVAVLKGWLRFSVKRAIVLTLLVVVIGGVLASFTQAVDQDELPFIAKLFNSMNELNIENYDDQGDINTNWRGFESFVALATYLNGSEFEWVFGQGSGTLVDLGFYIDLGGNELRYIPMLHNGFMYILLKFGVVGIGLYLYFMYTLISAGRSWRDKTKSEWSFAERLVSSLGWLFLFTTIVIAGILNKYEMESAMVLLGATLAWVNRQRTLGEAH
jgi:hypothetical protein